jgi:[ribosomal protein S18]-alanine N-acetyltransferase
MLVRPARLGEAKEIAQQFARTADEGWIAAEPPVDLGARAERFRTAIEAEPPATTFVLEHDGQTVGHGGIQPTHAEGVVSFGMAVIPEARGKGGGRMLLERIVEHAREHGSHKIELEVWTDNARAISLYATSGFEVEGLRRDHYRRKDGSLRSALVMARLL